MKLDYKKQVLIGHTPDQDMTFLTVTAEGNPQLMTLSINQNEAQVHAKNCTVDQLLEMLNYAKEHV